MTKLFTIDDFMDKRPDQMIEKIRNNCEGNMGKNIVETLSQVDRYGCSILHAIVGRKPGQCDLAEGLRVKSYFPVINCNDLDKDTVKSIIQDSEALEAYQQIYQIVTNDCSNLDIISTDVLQPIIELAKKDPTIKNLFNGLDNTCPFVREFEKFLAEIGCSPQFDLEFHSSLTKVELLIDFCETMGWKTDKLRFEKIKENLEKYRPSYNQEQGL